MLREKHGALQQKIDQKAQVLRCNATCTSIERIFGFDIDSIRKLT